MKKYGSVAALVLLTACGYQKKSESNPAPQPGSSDATPEQVVAVGLALPDRNIVVPEVAEAFGKINSYALRIWPTDPACPKGSRLDQAGTYPELNQVDISLVRGCDYEAVIDLGYDDGTAVPDPKPEPDAKHATYATDIKPILDVACISCHGPNGSRAQTDLTSYATVKNFADKVVTRVLDGTMPPSGPLSDTAKEVFTAWRNDGYPAGAVVADPVKDPVDVVSFEGDIKPLIDNYCVGCHSPGGKRPGSDFTTWEGVEKFKAGVVAKVLDGTMPKGAGPLSVSVRQTFQDWKDGGFAKTENTFALTYVAGGLKEVHYRTSASFWIPVDKLATGKTVVLYPTFRLQAAGEKLGLRSKVLATDPNPAEQPARVTYDNKIAGILQGYCVGCHGKGGLRASSDLSTYNGVIAYRAQVVDLVLQGLMPKGGPLGRADKTAFEQWGDQGYPEF